MHVVAFEFHSSWQALFPSRNSRRSSQGLQALQSNRSEAVSVGDKFLDIMQSQGGQAHALELINSEGGATPALALMSDALPASQIAQEALQEGLPVSLLVGGLDIAHLPILAEQGELEVSFPRAKQGSHFSSHNVSLH